MCKFIILEENVRSIPNPQHHPLKKEKKRKPNQPQTNKHLAVKMYGLQ